MEITKIEEIGALIARNLSGDADLNEIAQLNEWIGKSEVNKQYFEQIKNIWDASYKNIDREQIDTPKALETVHGRISNGLNKRNNWYNWRKVAAIIVFPLAIGSLLWVYNNKWRTTTKTDEPLYIEVSSALGTRSALKLADSTLVWLNSGSTLKYPDRFNDKDRHVFLNGEAYFEVKSDIQRPFIVQTTNLKVKATGTKFCVFEYENNPNTEVTLISGKVYVNESVDNPLLISELNPNQHLIYNSQTKNLSIIYDDTYRYIAWKDGKLIFRNETLNEVVNKISQIFNVDIEIQNKGLENLRYHATFKDESLDEILKLLKLTSTIDYKEVKREPLSDGSFPRRKVIIFKGKSRKV